MFGSYLTAEEFRGMGVHPHPPHPPHPHPHPHFAPTFFPVGPQYFGPPWYYQRPYLIIDEEDEDENEKDKKRKKKMRLGTAWKWSAPYP